MYKVKDYSYYIHPRKIETYLEDMHKKGWELISVLGDTTGECRFIFKKIEIVD